MPPAVTLIELCDLANRVLTNGSGNTATILDSLTERSRILAAQAAEVDLPGPAHLLKIGRVRLVWSEGGQALSVCWPWAVPG